MEDKITHLKYDIQRSKRKTIAIMIEPNGCIKVKAPYKLSDAVIFDFVESKRAWIDSKLAMIISRQRKMQSFENDADLYIMGRWYTLKLEKDTKASVALKGDCFLVKYHTHHIQTLVENHIKQLAKGYLTERLEVISCEMGLRPNKVSIKSQKKRWGSCTSNKHILLNWRLIFAPLEVIDYVIYHELAHLVHMNHSKAFWDTVRKHDPDYERKKTWLKENAYIIEWPNDSVNKTL